MGRQLIYILLFFKIKIALDFLQNKWLVCTLSIGEESFDRGDENIAKEMIDQKRRFLQFECFNIVFINLSFLSVWYIISEPADEKTYSNLQLCWSYICWCYCFGVEAIMNVHLFINLCQIKSHEKNMKLNQVFKHLMIEIGFGLWELRFSKIYKYVELNWETKNVSHPPS